MLRLNALVPFLENSSEAKRQLDAFQEIMFNDKKRHEIEGGLPLLLDTPYGARFRTSVSNGKEGAPNLATRDAVAHPDQLLAKLFCLGRSLDDPIVTPAGRHLTTRALIDDSLATFSRGKELEWSLIAYCGYLETLGFETGRGKQCSILTMAEDLLSVPDGIGACHGTHRLVSLAVCRQRLVYAARLEQTTRFEREKIAGCMQGIDKAFEGVCRQLAMTQSRDGWWDERWAVRPGKDSAPASSAIAGPEQISNRIRATGHLLEWLALLSPEQRLPDSSIRNAVLWLRFNVLTDPDYMADRHLLETSHVLTALVDLCEIVEENDVPLDPNPISK